MDELWHYHDLKANFADISVGESELEFIEQIDPIAHGVIPEDNYGRLILLGEGTIISDATGTIWQKFTSNDEWTNEFGEVLSNYAIANKGDTEVLYIPDLFLNLRPGYRRH